MFYYFISRLCLLVQCFRESLVGSPPDTHPGDAQASVGEADIPLLDCSLQDIPLGNAQVPVIEADTYQLDDSSLLPLSVSVQVSIEEAAAKNSTG